MTDYYYFCINGDWGGAHMIISSMIESSPDSYECISFLSPFFLRCKNDQQLPGRKDEIQMLTPRSVRPIVSFGSFGKSHDFSYMK